MHYVLEDFEFAISQLRISTEHLICLAAYEGSRKLQIIQSVHPQI